MSRTRVCGDRCHAAKHPRCKCWCGGAFHGEEGGAARSWLTAGLLDVNKLEGYEKKRTVYKEQLKIKEVA